MADLEKLYCTDSRIESLKKINAIIDNMGEEDSLNLPVFSANSGNTDENGNADLLYLPSMGTQQVLFQLDGTTTATGYILSNTSDTSQINIQTWTNGATSGVGSSTAKHIFATPKTTPIAFTIAQNCAANGQYSNATLTLTFDDNSTEVISLGTITYSTTPFEVGYYESGKSVVSIEFYGLWTFPSNAYNQAGIIIQPKYETITISTSTSCYFKVGGNYPNLVATSTERTFEKSYLEPITAETDGIFNVFVSETETYALANTVYRQKTEPTAVENDVWLNTATQPYKAYKYAGSEWEECKDVPIGSFIVSGGIITSVKTFEYNSIINKQEIMSWNIPSYNAGISKSANTEYTADTAGLVIALGSTQTGQGFYTDTITVNGVIVDNSYTQGSGWRSTMKCFVDAGDKYKINVTGTRTLEIAFYPLKGL